MPDYATNVVLQELSEAIL